MADGSSPAPEEAAGKGPTTAASAAVSKRKFRAVNPETATFFTTSDGKFIDRERKTPRDAAASMFASLIERGRSYDGLPDDPPDSDEHRGRREKLADAVLALAPDADDSVKEESIKQRAQEIRTHPRFSEAVLQRRAMRIGVVDVGNPGARTFMYDVGPQLCKLKDAGKIARFGTSLALCTQARAVRSAKES